MQPSDVRKMGADELGKKAGELRDRVARLTLKRNARRLDKPSELIAARRDLARVLTIQNEKGGATVKAVKPAKAAAPAKATKQQAKPVKKDKKK